MQKSLSLPLLQLHNTKAARYIVHKRRATKTKSKDPSTVGSVMKL